VAGGTPAATYYATLTARTNRNLGDAWRMGRYRLRAAARISPGIQAGGAATWRAGYLLLPYDYRTVWTLLEPQVCLYLDIALQLLHPLSSKRQTPP